MTNCTASWNNFEGDIPDPLVRFFIVYCCGVLFIGTLCNIMAIWCVVECSKTPSPVKILLCALFSSTLLMCLLVMPYMAHSGMNKLSCDVQVPRWVNRCMVTLYIMLSETELLFITLMALFRAVAVWSITKRQMKMRTSVALLFGIVIYSILVTMVLVVPYWFGVMTEDIGKVTGRLWNVMTYLLPTVFTMACYLSMILAVRRNKHRLAATPDTATTGAQVMDQATRAMLAVFISNLFLCLPHCIYHLLRYDNNVLSYVIMHIIFFAHLFVDPLAFVCSNLHHRHRVLQALKSCLQCVICKPFRTLPRATSTHPLHLTSSSSISSEEQRQEQI